VGVEYWQLAILVMRRLLGLAMFFSAVSVSAGEGDVLRPFVNVSMGYDSNLFRFASDSEASAVGASPLSPLFGITSIDAVTYQRYGAGVDLDWKQGRQEITARLAADKTSFSKFSSLLDYTGRDINGEWKWQLGNRWSGRLLASQNRTLAPYSDTLTGTIGSNVRTDDRQVFQADYWFHTDWRARAGLSNFSSAYSSVSQRTRDNQNKRATLGLYRLGQTIESVGVELSNTQGSYNSLASSDFREQGVRLLGIWNYSGKSRFTGRVGYVQRTRQTVVGRDYSGPDWRLEARWLPTGKTQFEGAFYRDLRANDTALSGYEVVDGISFSAVWLVAPKTRLIGQGSYERIEYQGSTQSDKLASLGLSASYEVWRGGEISAGLQHSQRQSNVAAAGFNADTLFVSANLKF
jgi:exopolysaccharide biosynthesis operon protein EpsL